MCFAVTCWLTRLTRDILTNEGFFLKSSSVQSWYLTRPVESWACSSRKSMLSAKMLLVSISLNKYSALMGALLCCAHFNFTKPRLLVASRIYGGTWMDTFRRWEEILCYFWGPEHGHFHVSCSLWYSTLFIYFRWGVGVWVWQWQCSQCLQAVLGRTSIYMILEGLNLVS